MLLFCVFKSGAAAQMVFDFPPYSGYPANEPFFAMRIHRHKISPLSNPFGRQEPRQQHVGIRQIQLLGLHLLKLGKNTIASPLSVVEQCGKETWGIEPRETH